MLSRRALSAWRRLGSGAFVTFVVACGGGSPPPSGLRAELNAGCSSAEACSSLHAQSRARLRECEFAATPRDCSPERADAALAEQLLRPFEQREEERRLREERIRTARAEREEAAREEERKRRVASEHEAATRHEAELEEARTIRARTYRAIGPAGRSAYLSACHANGQEVIAPEIIAVEGANAAPKTCSLLLYLLLAEAASDAEGDALLAQAERHLATTAPRDAAISTTDAKRTSSRGPRRSSSSPSEEEDGGSRPLLCCDGTPSPTCTCGGPRRGCCSHHHGVCGCVD